MTSLLPRQSLIARLRSLSSTGFNLYCRPDSVSPQAAHSKSNGSPGGDTSRALAHDGCPRCSGPGWRPCSTASVVHCLGVGLELLEGHRWECRRAWLEHTFPVDVPRVELG